MKRIILPLGVAVSLAVVLSACGPGYSGLGQTTTSSTTSSSPQYATVSLFAGNVSGWGDMDGKGAAASFVNPWGLALNSSGVLFVTDSGNATVRSITTADGNVSTLAGLAFHTGLISSGSSGAVGSSANFTSPTGVAVDGLGNQYVADKSTHIIYKIDTSQKVTVFAGSNTAGFVDTSQGPVQFNGPTALAVDSSNNIYVADSGNHAIRMITPAGVVTTIAGTGSKGTADGAASSAKFNNPQGITIDGSGNIFVADTDNHTIREITSTKNGYNVSTLYGMSGTAGNADGAGSTALFNAPKGLVLDATGNLYICDSLNGLIREVVNGSNNVSTLPGVAGNLTQPVSVQWDSKKNVLYVSDFVGNVIRKIDLAQKNTISTLAGTSALWGAVDGSGSSAMFTSSLIVSPPPKSLNVPMGIATDSAGNFYVADTGNHTIRKIDPTGAVSTLAGSSGSAGAVDASKNTSARFNYPAGVALDRSGNIFVADTLNNVIRKINVGGGVSLYAGNFNAPNALAVAADGTIYVADTGNNLIRKIAWDAAAKSWTVYTLAGSGGNGAADNVEGIQATFSSPAGIAVSADGKTVYVTDFDEDTLRAIDTQTTQVTTIVGSAGVRGVLNDTGVQAHLDKPAGIAIDSSQNIYIAEWGSCTIRKVTIQKVVTTVAGVANKCDPTLNSQPGIIPRPLGIVVLPGNQLAVTTNNGVIKIQLPSQ